MKRRSWLVVAVLLGAGPAHADPRSLTLAEAVEMARQNAVGVVRAEGAAENAGQGVRTSLGALLPSFSLTSGSTYQLGATRSTRVENGQIVTVSPQPWSSSLGVSANLLLFDGGKRFFDLRQARATRVSADVDEDLARWQAALDAKQAFFDVLAARETQVAAQAQLDQADRQRWVAIERTRAKAATRSDSLRAEIQVRAARLAVLEAGTAKASADAALARAIGSLEPVTAAATDTTEPSLAVDDLALAALAEDAPAVRGARARLEASRQAQKGSWTAYLPSVSAVWSHSGSGAVRPGFYGPSNLDYSGAVKLSLSFPLFNQFQRESDVVVAGVAVHNAEAELRDTQLAARQALTDGLGQYRAAGHRVASQVATVEAAIEDLRVMSQRYGVGGSTLLDVLASQTQLDQARRDLIRARYDQRVAKAQLEALVGRDL
jgi:outer membrane protein